VSFSPTLADVDRIDMAVGSRATAFIVAEGCPGLAAAQIAVVESPGIAVRSLTFQSPIVVANEAFPVVPPMDGGTHLLMACEFELTQAGAAEITVTGPPLAWAQLPEARRMGFETISYGGVNQNAPPDAYGCLASDVAETERANGPVRIMGLAPNPRAIESGSISREP